MQTEPLSPQQDDQPSEPIPALESTPPELTPIQEIVKLEPAPVQQMKSGKRNTSAIALGVIAFILLVAVAGLGFWAFTLNTKLTASQQQLTALQAEHGKLQADYATITSDKEKLNSDLTQTKTDLEKSNTDLTSAQADLKESQDQNKGFQATITSASKKAEILYAFTVGKTAKDILAIDTMIKATNDQKLLTQWTNFVSAPSTESSVNFLNYLIAALRTELK